MGATGNQAASTPQPPPDGGNGCGGAGPDLALSAGGGGADSGALTQEALHPADYRGFRQNANEQARDYAIMAVLAPMRTPVVVGVITFGLLNPDPAYGPTPQTVPENRPSLLEQAGQVGLAVAIGAIGIKLEQVLPAAEGAEAAAVHGNSLGSQSEQHVYEILRTNAAGDTAVYKYGVSGGPLNAAGLSVRAETQVSTLTRMAGGKLTYESSIVERIPGGPGSRGAALSLEKNLVYKYKELSGRKPEGNEKP
jgi:hypothetical protein